MQRSGYGIVWALWTFGFRFSIGSILKKSHDFGPWSWHFQDGHVVNRHALLWRAMFIQLGFGLLVSFDEIWWDFCRILLYMLNHAPTCAETKILDMSGIFPTGHFKNLGLCLFFQAEFQAPSPWLWVLFFDVCALVGWDYATYSVPSACSIRNSCKHPFALHLLFNFVQLHEPSLPSSLNQQDLDVFALISAFLFWDSKNMTDFVPKSSWNIQLSQAKMA